MNKSKAEGGEFWFDPVHIGNGVSEEDLCLGFRGLLRSLNAMGKNSFDDYVINSYTMEYMLYLVA